MKKYICFVDGKGFAVVNSEHGTISYTLIFVEASEAICDDWSPLMKKKKVTDYHLLLSFKV